MRFPSNSRYLIPTRLFFIIGALIIGSDAAPFTSGTDELQTAVDNCLAVDATGVTCCATADCGPAGSAEMKDWDVSSVTDMNQMFQSASAFNADISGWVVSSVTNMYQMFSQASAFNADISGWDVSSVTDMGNMFQSASAFNADLSSWNVSSVTDMRSMRNMFEGSAVTSFPSWYSGGACPSGYTGTATCTRCPKGKWQGEAGQLECIACNQPDWCPGGESCVDGREGPACSFCEDDWYPLKDVCYPCKQDAQFYLLLFLGISVFTIFIAAVVFPGKVKATWKRLRRAKKQAEVRLENIQKKRLGERASKFGAVVFLVSLVTFLQIQTLVVSVAVPWPSAVTALFQALDDIVNLDAWGFINPKCSLGNPDPGFGFSWLIRLLSPFLILMVVAGGIVFTFRKSGDDHTIDGVVRLVVQVLQVTFVGNVVHTMQPLDCAEYACIEPKDETHNPCYDGKHRVMKSSPDHVCTTEDPGYVIFLVCSLIGFIGYAVAYVVFIAYLLRRTNILAREHKDYVATDTDITEIALDPLDDEDPLAEEDGQFERLMRETHPDIQRLIRRYGLLFLPYSQRTWSWEIVAMARKSLMALTAVFFTTTPILQLELMLAQNVSWLVLLLWFRPFAAVPLMGGPFESKLHGDDRIARADQRWSSGNIVEIGMACCTITLNVIGLTIGDGDLTAQLVFFFGQLIVVGALITRAVQSMGNQSVPFFGSVGDHMWKAMEEFGLSVEAAAERLRDFVLRRSGSDGEEETR